MKYARNLTNKNTKSWWGLPMWLHEELQRDIIICDERSLNTWRGYSQGDNSVWGKVGERYT